MGKILPRAKAARCRLDSPREPKGAAADWTKERRRSDEGRRRIKRRPEASGKIGQ
jgi:hypothetical protein